MIFVVLDAEAAAEVASALADRYRRSFAEGRTRRPELLEAAEQLMERARTPEIPADSGSSLAIVTLSGDGAAMEPLFVPYREAARRLGVNVSTVRRLVAAGELHVVDVGGAHRIAVADLTAYAEQLTSRAGFRARVNVKGAP